MSNVAVGEPVKASVWFAACNIIRKIIVYISMPIFTRIMSTEQYGIYTMYCSWSEILFLFTTLSISVNVYNKCIIKYKKDIFKFTSSALWLTTLLSIFIGTLLLVSYKGISGVIQLPPIIIVMIIIDSVFSPAFSFWAVNQRFEYKYKKIILFTLIQTVLNPVLGVILVLNMDDAGIGRCASVVVANLILGIPLYIYYIIKGKCLYDSEYWKYALMCTIPLLPHYLSQVLLNQMDRIMIGNICGSSFAAIYGVAYSVSIALLIVNKAINDSFTPWLYKKLERADYNGIKAVSNKLIMMIAAMYFFVILLGPEVIKVLGSSEYSDAIWIIPPVSISGYLLFIYALFCNVEFYFEVQKYMTLFSVFAALINYITNKYFIAKYGYIAAGYTTLFCYLIFSISHFIIMNKTLEKNGIKEKIYDGKTILAITIFMIVFGLAILSLYKYPLIRLCIIGCIGIFVIFNIRRLKTYIIKVLKKDF